MTHLPVRVAVGLALAAVLATACSSAATGSASAVGGAGGASTTGSTDPLVIGSIVPLTGPLAVLGPPMTEGAVLAVSAINDAGGVLGRPVPDVGFVDDAGDAATASRAADRLLRSGVDAIVGPAGSGLSLAVIDAITGSEVVQCSPSDTAPTFTGYDDGGYYFRTAPSDALQGPVLAGQMVEGGATRVALLARADDYGRGVVGSMTPVLEDAGVEVVSSTFYDPRTPALDATIQQLVAADPDAVAIIALDEGAELLRGMVEAGLAESDAKLYGSDGLRDEALAAQVSPTDPGLLEGFRGTARDPSADPGFVSRLTAAAPSLTETTHAARTYDCVTVVALAAQSAGSTDPTVFARHVVGVTRDGERCTTFAGCLAILAVGGDIDYDGPSGPLGFTEAGEPETSRYEVREIDGSGTWRSVDVRGSS